MYLLIEEPTNLHYDGAEVTKIEAWTRRGWVEVKGYYQTTGAKRRTSTAVPRDHWIHLHPRIRRLLQIMAESGS